MNRLPNSRSREDFINESEKLFKSRVKAIQSRLLTVSRNYFSDNLDSEDGRFNDSVRNLNIIRRLDKLVGQTIVPSLQDLLQWFVNRILKLARVNLQYFGRYGSNEDISTKAVNGALRSLGVTIRNGVINYEAGGYAAGLIDITRPLQTIKAIARTAVSSPSTTITNFKRALRGAVIGRGVRGLIEREILDRSTDVFTMVDRQIGFRQSTSLQMRAAIYQGGIISTSRKFCKDRNDKVFTFDEIRAFADVDFPEKPSPYDPFTQLGGFNCRHQLDFIPDELAIILRPELANIWGITV